MCLFILNSYSRLFPLVPPSGDPSNEKVEAPQHSVACCHHFGGHRLPRRHHSDLCPEARVRPVGGWTHRRDPGNANRLPVVTL